MNHQKEKKKIMVVRNKSHDQRKKAETRGKGGRHGRVTFPTKSLATLSDGKAFATQGKANAFRSKGKATMRTSN